jgi:hypothetical protein
MAGTETALERVQESRLRSVHTSFPAKVQSYDATRKTADLVPMVDPVIPGADPEDDEDIEDPLPALMNVPVIFPRAGGATIEFDVVAGDTVLVVVCERDIKRWLATGERGRAQVQGLHTLNGAVAYPGLVPFNAPAPTFTVSMKSTRMEVGGNTDAAPRDSLVQQAFTTLKNAISAASTAPGDGGAAFKAALVSALSAWPPSTASAKLKLGG